MRKLSDNSAVRQQVMDAIMQCDDSVSVANVVSITGLPTLEATLILNRLAWEKGGHLRVTENGGILYHFDAACSGKTALGRFAETCHRVCTVLAGMAMHLFRLSFGLMLVLSLTITQIITSGGLAVLGAMTGVSGSSASSRFNLLALLRGLVSSYGAKSKRLKAVTGFELFLESCFFFVFGPGDPNTAVDELNWKFLAHKIASCQGIVGEDELAPFLMNRGGRKRANEILEIVVHFDGIPECSDQGQIIFRFPSLQGTADSFKGEAPLGLEEALWQFSGLGVTRTLPVAGMVYGNFALISGLNYLLQFLPWFGSLPVILVTASAFWFYAGVIAMFPPCRFFLNFARNRPVKARNASRMAAARLLMEPDAAMAARLNELKELRRNAPSSSVRVIYDTNKSYLEQSDRSWNPERGFAV